MGIKIKVANAYKVKLIAEAKIKTDKVDANILSDLLRTDFVAEVYIPPKDIRIWRWPAPFFCTRRKFKHRILNLLDLASKNCISKLSNLI